MRGTLVLDGTPRSVITICRSLHRHGIPVFCARFSGSRLGLFSNAVRGEFVLSSDDGFFASDLAAVLRRYDIDTILPCSDRALRLLVPHYEEISQLAVIAGPQSDVLERVLDKAKTLDAARRCGVPVPKTAIVSDARDWPALARTQSFPAVVKPATVGKPSAFKARIVRNEDEFRALYETLPAAAYAVQEYVRGEGVGVSTIVRDGHPLILFQHRRIHEYPASGGVGVLVESESLEPKLGYAATALLRQLDWRGPAMVEFRHDKRTGDYALMEVNGRFWGSLALSVQAGVDFPLMTWQSIRRMDPQVPTTYRSGVRTRWTAGEIARLVDMLTEPGNGQSAGRLAAVTEFSTSFSPVTHSALFSIGDPVPELLDVTVTVARVTAAKLWRALQRFLPKSFVQRISQLRLLDGRCRKTYLLRLLDRWLSRRSEVAPFAKNARQVTIVCRANRIRSPLAAAILESEVRRTEGLPVHVFSAGTRADSSTDFDPRAREAAAAMGLALAGKPTPVSARLVEDSELVIVMDRVVEAELLTLFPSARAKIFLLSEIAGPGESGGDEILDPDKHTPTDFSRSITELEATIRRMARLLLSVSC